MNWNAYFAMMEDWKRLPAYKVEPRIDSLIGFYLPKMAGDFLNDKIVGIIPELPIRLGTVTPDLDKKVYADKSYKVDFFLLGTSGTNYFVELKTDSGSLRKEQDEYLNKSKAIGMKAIIIGILRIASVSSYRQKYDHLIEKLANLNLINGQRKFVGKSEEIRIVYVQPNRQGNSTQNIIDFEWMAKWLTDKYGKSDFESALAKSLLKWAKD